MGEGGEIFLSLMFFAAGSGALGDLIAGLFQFMFSFGRGTHDFSFLYSNIFVHLFLYILVFLVHHFDLFYAERFHIKGKNVSGVFLSGLMFLFLFHIILYFIPDSWKQFVALSIVGMITIGYIFWLKYYYIEERKDIPKRRINFPDIWSRKPTQTEHILRGRLAGKVRNADFVADDVKRTYASAVSGPEPKKDKRGAVIQKGDP